MNLACLLVVRALSDLVKKGSGIMAIAEKRFWHNSKYIIVIIYIIIWNNDVENTDEWNIS